MGQPSHRLADSYVVGNLDRSSVNISFLNGVGHDCQSLDNSVRALLSSKKLANLIANTRNAGASPFAISLLLTLIICVVVLFNIFSRNRFRQGTTQAARATDDIEIEL